MKKIITSFTLFLILSLSYSQSLTIFGGLNNSSARLIDDIDWPSGYEQLSLSGFNYGVESDLGSDWLGLGINSRGFGLKVPVGQSEDITYNYNFNYYTLHSILPISISEKMTIFGGIQAGFISSDYVSVDEGNDDARILPPYVSRNDNGLMMGLQFWLTNEIGLRATYYHGLADFDTYTGAGDISNNTSSISFVYKIINSSGETKSWSGPSAKPRPDSKKPKLSSKKPKSSSKKLKSSSKKPKSGSKKPKSGSKKPKSGSKKPKKPGATGSSEIDDFVNSAYDLNDKLLALKEKLDNVSSGLKESNEIMSEINNNPDGALGWVSNQLAKGTSKAVNNMKTINISAGLDGLNPAQKLRDVLQKLKFGVVDGKNKLETIPNDLEALAKEATNLMSSAASLPQAAASLGFKAPKGLKAIKNASGVIKNIPKQVSNLGSSAKSIAEEIEQFMKNIGNLLKG